MKVLDQIVRAYCADTWGTGAPTGLHRNRDCLHCGWWLIVSWVSRWGSGHLLGCGTCRRSSLAALLCLLTGRRWWSSAGSTDPVWGCRRWSSSGMDQIWDSSKTASHQFFSSPDTAYRRWKTAWQHRWKTHHRPPYWQSAGNYQQFSWSPCPSRQAASLVGAGIPRFTRRYCCRKYRWGLRCWSYSWAVRLFWLFAFVITGLMEEDLRNNTKWVIMHAYITSYY